MLSEPRCVILIDNTSTHMLDEVQIAIENIVAVLIIYSVPFPPHLNPIEPSFGIYKAYLKQNYERMHADWYTAHLEELNEIDVKKVINSFKDCNIPGKL